MLAPTTRGARRAMRRAGARRPAPRGSTTHLGVDLEQAVEAAALARQRLQMTSAGDTERAPERVVAEDREERRRQPRRVIPLDEQTGLAVEDQLRRPAHAGRD